jgi:thioredoxin-like negative regulator of GroEL
VLGGTQRIFDQQLFDRALQLRPAHPDDPLVAKTLGIQTLLKGDHSRALTLLKECLSNRSQDAVARYYLGLAQHRSKDSTYKKTLQEALDAGLAEASLVTEARRLLKE